MLESLVLWKIMALYQASGFLRTQQPCCNCPHSLMEDPVLPQYFLLRCKSRGLLASFMTLVLHCLFNLLLQSFPMFSVSQIFPWLNNKQRSHITWLAWVSRDCHLMSVAIIYLNIYWVPIKFQEWEAPICTAVSKIQLPVDNLLKALIVILRKQKPWCFSPSKKHHKSYTYFQSHIPFSSSEKILRHPHFFQRYIWSLFKKIHWPLSKCISIFISKSHF